MQQFIALYNIYRLFYEMYDEFMKFELYFSETLVEGKFLFIFEHIFRDFRDRSDFPNLNICIKKPQITLKVRILLKKDFNFPKRLNIK